MTRRSRAGRLLAQATLAFCLLAHPAVASDFRFLAEPPTARMFLLSTERQLQMECAGLSLYRASIGGPVEKADAKRLVAGVGRRLAIDLGDRKRSQFAIESNARGHADPFRVGPEWIEMRKRLAQDCLPLFAAANQSARALANKLGSLPRGPLQLPNAGQCLALAQYLKERNDPSFNDPSFDVEVASALHRYWLEGVRPSKRLVRETALATNMAYLASLKLDGDTLQGMGMACLPTTVQALKKLGTGASASGGR